MEIGSIPIKITDKDNKHIYILRNKVQDVVKKNHLPAEFRSEQIEIKNCTYNVLEQLKAMGVKIIEIK